VKLQVAQPINDFLHNEKCSYRKPITMQKLDHYQMTSIKRQILHVLWVVIVSTPGSAQTFSCYGNSSTACASFSLSIKRRADVTSVCFHLSTLCCLGYHQKIMKWMIVLETYVTSDVICSNLVLIFLTLCKVFSANVFERAKVVMLKTL